MNYSFLQAPQMLIGFVNIGISLCSYYLYKSASSIFNIFIAAAEGDIKPAIEDTKIPVVLTFIELPSLFLFIFGFLLSLKISKNCCPLSFLFPIATGIFGITFTTYSTNKTIESFNYANARGGKMSFNVLLFPLVYLEVGILLLVLIGNMLISAVS